MYAIESQKSYTRLIEGGELTGQRQRIGKMRRWLYGHPVLDGALRAAGRDGGDHCVVADDACVRCRKTKAGPIIAETARKGRGDKVKQKGRDGGVETDS